MIFLFFGGQGREETHYQMHSSSEAQSNPLLEDANYHQNRYPIPYFKTRQLLTCRTPLFPCPNRLQQLMHPLSVFSIHSIVLVLVGLQYFWGVGTRARKCSEKR